MQHLLNWLTPVLLISASFLCLVEETSAESRLVIVEPTNGIVVKPGERVRVRVEANPELLPATVYVIGGDTNKHPFGSGPMDGPPFEGYLDIPREASGSARIEAMLVGAGSDTRASSEPLSFTIVSNEAPRRLETQQLFQLPLHPLEPELAELRSRVWATGYFEGDVRRDISGPQFGTTYTSLTPNVITVTPEGRLMTIEPGYGFVLTENGGLRQYSKIVVDTEEGKSPPAEDRTASVAIRSSGFRRDPETGFFVQQLTLTNTSQIPMPKGINLVIDDLPGGVELKGSMGTPKPPLTGHIVHVDVKEEDFLSPGQTATATLKFSNREGVPITYSRKVYCGKRP